MSWSDAGARIEVGEDDCGGVISTKSIPDAVAGPSANNFAEDEAELER